jgi:hypothetical protein
MATGPQSTDTTLAGTIGNALPGIIQAGAGLYGSQNAAEKQTQADQNAINTQTGAMGNINNIWSTQQNLGQGADTALGNTLGTNGKAPDYSGFENMPGYQFAVQQGTQAIQRQAASMGNAYTPNTAQAVGQYVTGTAMQDYNTYVNQLMGAAGLGTTANQGLQTGTQNTSDNISQLQQNQGQAQASGVSGGANAIGGLFGPNGAGSSLIGAAGKYLNGGTGSSGGGGGGGIGGTGFNSRGIGTPVNTGNPFAGTNLSQGNYTEYNQNNGYGGGGDGTFGSGVDDNTGSNWIDPSNTGTPSFDYGSMGNMPSIDTGDMGDTFSDTSSWDW